MKRQVVIGLEIHLQLKTKTKLFCSCSTDYIGATPNTNVCPSMHVIGCVGLVAACCESPGLRRRHLQWVMIPLGVLICISTVFVKQHSILDMFVAIPYSVVAWLVSFQPWKHKKA